MKKTIISMTFIAALIFSLSFAAIAQRESRTPSPAPQTQKPSEPKKGDPVPADTISNKAPGREQKPAETKKGDPVPTQPIPNNVPGREQRPEQRPTPPTQPQNPEVIIVNPDQRDRSGEASISKEQKKEIKEVHRKHHKAVKKLENELKKEQKAYNKAMKKGASETELARRRQRIREIQSDIDDLNMKLDVEMRNILSRHPQPGQYNDRKIEDSRKYDERKYEGKDDDDDDDDDKGKRESKNKGKIKSEKAQGKANGKANGKGKK